MGLKDSLRIRPIKFSKTFNKVKCIFDGNLSIEEVKGLTPEVYVVEEIFLEFSKTSFPTNIPPYVLTVTGTPSPRRISGGAPGSTSSYSSPDVTLLWMVIQVEILKLCHKFFTCLVSV